MLRVVLFALALLALPAAALGAQAKRADIVFGAFNSGAFGRNEFTQLLNLMERIGEVIAKSLGKTFEVKQFQSEKAFDKAIYDGEVDLVLTGTHATRKVKFQPLVTYSFFKTDGPKQCLVARKSVKTKEALKGKVGVTLEDSLTRYWNQALFLGTNPFRYYGKLQKGKNDPSMLYAVALGEADAAWVEYWSMEFTRMKNPGPIKKLHRLGCVDYCPPSVDIHPNVPAAQRKKVQNVLLNLNTLQEGKRYRALFSSVGLRFRPFGEQQRRQCRKKQVADYDALGDAVKKDFHHWVNYMNNQ